MNNLEFRAWDKTKKQWAKFDHLLIDSEGGLHYFNEGGTLGDLDNEEYEIVFFTGLLDKNGKKIFKGDIVKYLGDNWVVYWSEILARFSLCMSGTARYLDYNTIVAKDCELIGDKFTTPELLDNI